MRLASEFVQFNFSFISKLNDNISFIVIFGWLGARLTLLLYASMALTALTFPVVQQRPWDFHFDAQRYHLSCQHWPLLVVVAEQSRSTFSIPERE